MALPVVMVNIGGVAQVTYISDDTILAFDTGPGNAPIDDWMLKHHGKLLDEDGAFARTGKIDDAAWTKCWTIPSLPVSRRNRWIGWISAWTRSPISAPKMAPPPLTAFTAASLARAREHFPEPASLWAVSGGGRHNIFLMDQLRARVNAPVISAEMPAGTAIPWRQKASPIWRCARRKACRFRFPPLRRQRAYDRRKIPPQV